MLNYVHVLIMLIHWFSLGTLPAWLTLFYLALSSLVSLCKHRARNLFIYSYKIWFHTNYFHCHKGWSWCLQIKAGREDETMRQSLHLERLWFPRTGSSHLCKVPWTFKEDASCTILIIFKWHHYKWEDIALHRL